MLVEVPGGIGATITDATGAFVLLDVPEGTSSLRVSGGSANATLRIRAIVSTEYRRMTVSVSGGVADESGEQTETEFHGTIDAIDAAANMVTIGNGTASRKVMVTDATVIKEKGAVVGFDALARGQRVEVRGTLQADGTVAARGIRIDIGGDDRGANGIALVGTLNGVDGTRLTVGGLAVDVSTAEIYPRDIRITVADLHLNDHLLVCGALQADNGIVASSIRVLVAEGEPEDFHVAGKVTSIDAAGNGFTIGETSIASHGRSPLRGRGSRGRSGSIARRPHGRCVWPRALPPNSVVPRESTSVIRLRQEVMKPLPIMERCSRNALELREGSHLTWGRVTTARFKAVSGARRRILPQTSAGVVLGRCRMDPAHKENAWQPKRWPVDFS